MAEYSFPWTGGGGGDDGPYSADEFAAYMEMLFQTDEASTQGVIPGYLNELSATVPAGNTVRVASGGAVVKGRFYRNTSPVDVSVPSPTVAARYDRIVLRGSWSTQTIRIYRIAGTEGGSAPSLTQEEGVTWDLPLWQVYITTGGNITLTDERSYLAFGTTIDGSRIADRSITQSKLTAGAYIPVGGIIMWAGTLGGTGNKYPLVDGVPDTCWHVCDGTDGTPDLRDKFMVGAGNLYARGATGGAATHTHSVNIASDLVTAHTHTLPADTGDVHAFTGSPLYMQVGSTPYLPDHYHYLGGSTGAAGGHQHGVNGNTGSSSSLPPYYGIYFIQRIA